MSLICFDNLKFFERKKLNVSFEILIFVAPWSVPHHSQPPSYAPAHGITFTSLRIWITLILFLVNRSWIKNNVVFWRTVCCKINRQLGTKFAPIFNLEASVNFYQTSSNSSRKNQALMCP